MTTAVQYLDPSSGHLLYSYFYYRSVRWLWSNHLSSLACSACIHTFGTMRLHFKTFWRPMDLKKNTRCCCYHHYYYISMLTSVMEYAFHDDSYHSMYISIMTTITACIFLGWQLQYYGAYAFGIKAMTVGTVLKPYS